ncbi:amine sulfotransferase-like [Dermacentor variabilis]|uniref:amine sulfotransferase-like n=1 Tax=Dermacentor variabilis TaxID=34621 RepID=UPI003F5C077C
MVEKRLKPYAQIVDGMPRCPFATPESIRNALQFVTKKGDLLQASFPKSGTHWVQYITQLILNDGKPLDTYEQFTKRAPFIEYHVDAAKHQTSAPVRTFCTHLPLCSEKLNPEAKYVYVARNPWDVCVSLYHHMTSLSFYQFQDGTFDDFLESFLTGSLPYGCYFEHLEAGYLLKGKPNVLFLTYEELKRDIRDALLRLANFIGEHYGNLLKECGIEGRTQLDAIVQMSSAESIRKVMAFDLGGHPDPEIDKQLKSLSVSSRVTNGGDAKRYNFVRKAKTGEWKEHFSPEQLRRMEARIAENTTCSSVIMDLWSDIRAEALNRPTTPPKIPAPRAVSSASDELMDTSTNTASQTPKERRGSVERAGKKERARIKGPGKAS